MRRRNRKITAIFMAAAMFGSSIAVCGEETKGTEVVTEKVTEEAAEPVSEKAVGQAPEKVTEEAAEPVSEKAAGQAPEKVTEEAAEPVSERAVGQAPEKVTEEAAESVSERAVGQAPEAEAEKAAEKVAESDLEKSEEKATEEVTEKSSETAVEENTEALREKVTEAETEDLDNVSVSAGAGENSSEATQAEASTEVETEQKDKKEKETESEAAKLRMDVLDSSGNRLTLQAISGPERLTCNDVTHRVDYMDGVYRVHVPERTETLEFVVKEPEDVGDVRLTKWNGYLAEYEDCWLLCPDDLMGQAFIASGNTYAVELEYYMMDADELSMEQLAVYGALSDTCTYAEVFLCSSEISAVLLIEMENEGVTDGETDNGISNEKVSGSEEMENMSEIELQTETLPQPGTELQTETLPEPGTELQTETLPQPGTELQTETLPEPGTELQTETLPQPGTELQTEILSESETTADLFSMEVVEGTVLDTMLFAASGPEIEQSYTAAGKNLADSAGTYIPTVASMNGEWQILGLARSGQQVEEGLYDKYIENVVNIVKEKEGVLHKKKYTEYSRVVLALTALGEDVTDVGGYNLLEPLADFDQTVWQGVNGAIFALIAFDSHDYEIPTAANGKTQTTRAKLINHILSQEVSGGGWDLSGRSADPDMTAMAIQALAPYYNTNTAVKNAVDRGVAKLSALQKKDGSYGSYGTVNSESCSQVIVALTALGIDPNTDSRFTKNGKSVVDALLTFHQSDGSFAHVSGGGSDQMATEQAYYALTSYQRFQNGQTALYDMSDVALQSDYRKAAEAGKLITALPGTITLLEKEQVQSALLAYNKLTVLQKSLVAPTSYEKLQAALKTLEELDVEMESEQQIESDTETEAITEKDPDDGSDDKNNTGTTQKPSGSNKKPSGTTKKVNLVSGSNRTGATAAGILTGKGTTSADSEEETETEETESRFSKRDGSTRIPEAAKDVITDMGSLFSAAKTGQQLPEHAADYSDVQIESILEIYRSYETLTEQEKDIVEKNAKYEKYLAVLEKMKAENHYDEATDTDLRDNEEEVLPWYVQMQVSPMLVEENSASAVREALKGQGELLTLSDISLIDLMEGGEWQPEDLVRVRLLQTDMDSYENFAVVHMKDDGGMEFIEAHISGSYLEFDTDRFSRFGIVGYNGSMEELMEDRSEEQIWIYLIPGAGAALLLLLLLVIRERVSRKKKS